MQYLARAVMTLLMLHSTQYDEPTHAATQNSIRANSYCTQHSAMSLRMLHSNRIRAYSCCTENSTRAYARTTLHATWSPTTQASGPYAAYRAHNTRHSRRASAHKVKSSSVGALTKPVQSTSPTPSQVIFFKKNIYTYKNNQWGGVGYGVQRKEGARNCGKKKTSMRPCRISE